MSSEPQITCPTCKTEIKLTESLAAPLIAETRRTFEALLARKEMEFGKREASLRQSQQEVARAREAIDDEVSKRLRTERSAIAVAEAAKARLAVAGDLEQRDRQVAELQHVFGTGQSCGTILWESKRTKTWNHAWLAKLRDDQRAAKAEIAIIVGSALPKGVEAFDFIENVWVADPRFAIPLAIALRQSLIDVAGSRLTQQGQQTKMALIYGYLTGPQFRHRIDAIVEKFSDMRGDLERERKVMTKLWARREEQLRCVLDSTAGLYGDLQGIGGRAIPEIASLDVLMIGGEGSSGDGSGISGERSEVS